MTPSTFSSRVSGAAVNDVLCLGSGSYGTWGGTNKLITVRAADGASPSMKISFGAGDSQFTLSGMAGMGGTIGGGAFNITVADSTFTSTLNISGTSTDNITVDGNRFEWPTGPSTGINAKLYLENSLTGTLATPSVTVSGNSFANGDLDGIHLGGGSGYQLVNNTFRSLCDQGANHTDNIQVDTSTTTNVRIAGNYVFAPQGCGTQAITSYDRGTSGFIIENNVVDIRRPWGIELYSDRNSIVRNNVVRYYPDSGCDFSGITCGKIDFGRKSSQPVSSGSQAYDNIGEVNTGGGTGMVADHNYQGAGVTFVGPLTGWAGFRLADGSLGENGARDGSDAGIR